MPFIVPEYRLMSVQSNLIMFMPHFSCRLSMKWMCNALHFNWALQRHVWELWNEPIPKRHANAWAPDALHSSDVFPSKIENVYSIFHLLRCLFACVCVFLRVMRHTRTTATQYPIFPCYFFQQSINAKSPSDVNPYYVSQAGQRRVFLERASPHKSLPLSSTAYRRCCRPNNLRNYFNWDELFYVPTTTAVRNEWAEINDASSMRACVVDPARRQSALR